MDWDALLQRLDAAFIVPALELPDGRALASRERVGFRATLRAVASNEEELEDVTTERTVEEILADRWQTRELLKFEWESLGPMSWFASLSLLDTGGSKQFLYLWDEALGEGGQDPYPVVAAIRPRATSALLCAFFRSLARENGSGYGVNLFGHSLPSCTTNYVPEMISAAVVSESYWAWMEWASAQDFGAWASLRNRVIRTSIDPNPLAAGNEALGQLRGLGRFAKHVPPTPEEIQAYLAASKAAREREERSLGPDDRRRIFDIFFRQAYREHGLADSG